AVALEAAPEPIAHIRQRPPGLREVALAPGIHSLGVLADDDEVDAVGIGQRRAHARVELRGTHAGPGVHLPAQPADHARRGRARGAEEHGVGRAARALRLLGDRGARRRNLEGRQDLHRHAGAAQHLARGLDHLEADGLPGKGVKFHDGSLMTSRDVKASYDHIIFPPASVVSSRQATYGTVESVEAPTPDTVVFRLKYAEASFMANLAQPWNWIYKADILAKDPNWYKKN